MNGLEGWAVIVTGGSSGLGAQLARALVAEGARPVLAARRAGRLAELAEELGAVDAIVCDVGLEKDRERLVETTFERHGRIDGLVNNAGIDAFGPASRTDPATFSRVLDVNLVAPFALSRLAVKRMREGGGKAIVNVASVMALRSIRELPDAAYVASKAGLIGLTRELASQWGRHGVRVNAVAPGFFPSEMTAGLGSEGAEFPPFLTENTPLGRGGRTGELDDAITFLLSPASSFVTGQVLTVDGGLSTR
jgi:NAD(P)-dependent dehydrogenase (short-subunit alcohol dehydrogenase family)